MPISAFTPHADLTPDQRARFGNYVLAKEQASSELRAMTAAGDRAEAALTACYGDKAKAFAMLLADRGDEVNLPRDHVRFMLEASVAAIEPKPERFDLTASVDGYVITDHGRVICRFHGPQFALAGKTLRALREDAE